MRRSVSLKTVPVLIIGPDKTVMATEAAHSYNNHLRTMWIGVALYMFGGASEDLVLGPISVAIVEEESYMI